VTTDIPAASSFAPLIRLPDDKRSIALSRSARVELRLRAAEIDGMFVLITTPMVLLLPFDQKFLTVTYVSPTQLASE
jgi:hypothetical protein